jgi:hypothetical protein
MMATKKAAEQDEPKAEPEKKPTQDLGTDSIAGKTIDQRMADLLKDHKRRGAR